MLGAGVDVSFARADDHRDDTDSGEGGLEALGDGEIETVVDTEPERVRVANPLGLMGIEELTG